MGRIVMKWGGGLITDKSTLCTVREDRLQALAPIVRSLLETGHDVVLVHGAGSFGHLLAREYRLAEGDVEGLDQAQAISRVRNDMDTLHAHVRAALEGDMTSHPPRDFVTNTGADFRGDLSRFAGGGLHLSFGDVVDCDPPKRFGILSGDDLMLRLATELPDVTHCIFCLGDVPGLMTGPGEGSELIPEWSSTSGLNGAHASEQDVTGGIFLKAERAASIAACVEQVWFVDGRHPERILEIVEGHSTIGTRIRA